MDWHKVIWIQPYRLTDVVARMRNGNAARREFETTFFAFTLNFLAIWLVICLLARYNPDIRPMNFLSFLALSIKCGFTLACFYQLHWLDPATVVLGKEYVAAVGWRNRRQWRYDEIACVHFDIVQKRARTFRVMRLVLHDGREIELGVPNRLDLSKAIDFLRNAGVRIANESTYRRESSPKALPVINEGDAEV